MDYYIVNKRHVTNFKSGQVVLHVDSDYFFGKIEDSYYPQTTCSNNEIIFLSNDESYVQKYSYLKGQNLIELKEQYNAYLQELKQA